jgi:hypothetical protein
LCAALIAALALPLLAAEQSEDLPALKTKVKTLAAFKNGLGFVFRAGETDLKDGWAGMDQIPAAALGTFWIGTTSKAGPVQEVVSYRSKLADQLEAINLAELVAANVGQTVTITYFSGANAQARTVTGKIESVAEDRKPEMAASSGFRSDSSYYPADLKGRLVFIASGLATLAIDRNDIRSIESAAGTALKTGIDREVSRAKVRLGGNPKSAEVTMAYLEKGINWSPSYLVNIKDEEQADITLEAVLANDVEDLEDVDVSFVVGYPNFMFADSITPLALQQTVAQFVQGLMGSRESGGRGGYGGAMAQSQSVAYNYSVGYDARGEWRPESTYSTTQPMPGETNEDLYFYQQEHVTLKKGDRARYTVFTGKAPYEHIYQWEIPDSMNIDERGYRQDSSRPAQDLSPVWHALRLENTTKHPWTTAPAFTVNGPMPVAQDVLKYTPPGGKSTLKLTVATDVRADQAHTEVSRTQISVGGYSYDEVVVNGKLTIKNWKRKAVKVNVKKSLIGDVKEAGQEGKVTKVVRTLTALNPTTEIEWEFDLDPGQEKELTYQYKALIHR